MLGKLQRRFAHLSRMAVWIGGLAILVSALLTAADVVGRKLFGVSIPVAHEVSGYVFAVATAWAFAFCVVERANVRIDLLYSPLHPAWKSLLDVLATISMLLLAIVLVVGAAATLSDSWESGTRATTALRTPLWIPQTFWFTGLLLWLATLIATTAYLLARFWHRDWAQIQRTAGIPSLEEAVRDETQGTSNPKAPD